MDGYKKELRLFNIKKINVLATALFAVAFLAGGLINIFAFHAVEKGYLVTGKIWLDVIIAIVTLAVGLFLHELYRNRRKLGAERTERDGTKENHSARNV